MAKQQKKKHQPIKVDPENYNIHPEENKALIKKSLEELGAGRSIVIDNENTTIGGAGVLEQAQELGIPIKVIETQGNELIAVKRTDLSPDDEKRKRLAIMDNSTAKHSHFDYEKMAEDFDKAELEGMGVMLPEIEETPKDLDDSYVTIKNIKTSIKKGDIFILIGLNGQKHIIACGDCTDKAFFTKCQKAFGNSIDVVFTDPHYGNGESGKYGRGQLGVRTIKGDEDLSTFEKFVNFNAFEKYVFFLQWRTFQEAFDLLATNELKLNTIGVWDKKNAGLNGGGGISEQWEAILFAGQLKYTKFGGNVFNVSRESLKRSERPHPHQKPIELLKKVFDFIDGKNFVDPFLGAASIMVAGHILHRNILGIDIEPTYCQVSIDRMLTLDKELEIYKGNRKVTNRFRSKLKS